MADASLGELNERVILVEQVRDAANEIKSGKAPCRARCISSGVFKKGGIAVLERLVTLLNISFDMAVVAIDWRVACIVTL